jgi:hypothetical protein
MSHVLQAQDKLDFEFCEAYKHRTEFSCLSFAGGTLMKRILIGAIFTVFLILLQPTPARLEEGKKGPTPWEHVGDFKVLRVWKTAGLELRWPEVAILQLTEKSRKELQSEPLEFLHKHKIFESTDRVQGQFVVRLTEPKRESKDPPFVIVVHDLGTYSATCTFDVSQIVP